MRKWQWIGIISLYTRILKIRNPNWSAKHELFFCICSMPALPAKLSLHLNCKQQFLWQFSVVLLVVVVAVQNWIKSTCNSCLWHVQSSIFLPCLRASLASWFVAAAPLRFAMPNMQRHYLSINTRPKCSNCNCNHSNNNNNNNSKSNSTLWHETHSTPGLVVCARFVGPQLWKFFKWCQITRCGHFLILILLLLLLLYLCFGHVQAGFSIWRVNWKRDSGVFFSPFLGQWPMFVLARFFCQPASISLPSSSYTHPLSIWSKEKHKRRI